MKIPSIPQENKGKNDEVPKDDSSDLADVLDKLIAENNTAIGPNHRSESWTSVFDVNDSDYDGYDYEDSIKF